MEKSDLLNSLCLEIQNIESDLTVMQDQMNSMTSKLGGIKKVFTLIKEEDERMAKEITKDSKKVIQLKNGKANMPYKEIVDLEAFGIPKDALIDFNGIPQLSWNKDDTCFEGDLILPGDYKGTLIYQENLNSREFTRDVHILINADPRTLWVDKDPPLEGPYYKTNKDYLSKIFNNRRLLGASVRGKSHAQRGTFRDDDFSIQTWDNGWILQVVSDGAGSAIYSREGSRMACQSVVDNISTDENREKIQRIEDLIVSLNSPIESNIQRENDGIDLNRRSEICSDQSMVVENTLAKDSIDQSIISEFVADQYDIVEGALVEGDTDQTEVIKDTLTEDYISQNKIAVDLPEETIVDTEEIKRKKLSTLIHELTVQAAFSSLKKIETFAKENNKTTIKNFSSTLLFTLSKEFDFGTAVISFSIGDGAIGVVTEKEGKLLMKPDGGEYSGQTYFITSKELFQNKDIYDRSKFWLFKDRVKSLMLMTDGISDPKFGTEKNLEDSNYWMKLWGELEPVIKQDPLNKEDVFEWLEFYEVGEYDDRTLVILY
ncbi:protein phosphatase 2C domain-containing protein [Halosquirtibacter xylanolyticus]|uniref:protein phosphatase 2C domain-containing protein n=1 Tax=Halosquirtibacter xylanolyticus TaxID=3374599 RepID=UPI003747D686|nr:protein phosphatase 2C domain-containing protein [Prolixibacteraceae bacterium]